jgi:hypothetical protein
MALMIRKVGLVLVSLVVSISVVKVASAESWVGAVQDIVECSDDGKCGPPDFRGTSPVTFFHIDTNRKVITMLAPDERRGETTEIQTIREVEGTWFVAGVENERAWSMVITSRGELTLSITMDGGTWSGFGKCMPAEHAQP